MLHAGDPHVLAEDAADQLVHLTDLRQALLLTLDAGQGALPGELVAQQLEGGSHGRHHIALDAVACIQALVGLAAGVEQHHGHARVGRHLGDNGVGAQVGVGVIGQHPGEGLAQGDTAQRAVEPGDVGEQVVHLAIHHGLPGGTAATVVLVGKALGLEQFHVVDVDGHGALQPEMKSPAQGRGSGKGQGSGSGGSGGATVKKRKVTSMSASGGGFTSRNTGTASRGGSPSARRHMT
ncbi:hypothetical protein D9M70_451780 [compost metagenome]